MNRTTTRGAIRRQPLMQFLLQFLLMVAIAVGITATPAQAVTDLAARVAWNGLFAETGTGQVLDPAVVDTHLYTFLCAPAAPCQSIETRNLPLPMEAEVSTAAGLSRATLAGLAGSVLENSWQAAHPPLVGMGNYSALYATVVIDAGESVTITVPVALTLTQGGFPGNGMYSTASMSLFAWTGLGEGVRDDIAATSIAGPSSIADTLTVTYTNHGRRSELVQLQIEATLDSQPLLVPEPRAWALLGAGLVLIGIRGAVRRR